VSDKERDLELSSLFKDVASIIAEKCINPSTQRPYTVSMIERALRDVHFSVDPKRSAKQQALHVGIPPKLPQSSASLATRFICENPLTGMMSTVQALPQLKQQLPIERARMRLRMQLPVSCRTDLLQLLNEKQATVESEDLGISSNQVKML
jgi:ribosome maturation protein SDO1